MNKPDECFSWYDPCINHGYSHDWSGALFWIAINLIIVVAYSLWEERNK